MRKVNRSILLLLIVIVAGLSGLPSASGQTRTTTITPPSGTTSPVGTTSPAGTTSSITRATFENQADALCKTANAGQAVVSRKSKGVSTAKLAPLLRQQAKIAATLAAALTALMRPAGDNVPIERFIGAVHQLSVYSTSLATAIAAGHASTASADAAKLVTARTRETLLAQGYGYSVCGSGTGY